MDLGKLKSEVIPDDTCVAGPRLDDLKVAGFQLDDLKVAGFQLAWRKDLILLPHETVRIFEMYHRIFNNIGRWSLPRNNWRWVLPKIMRILAISGKYQRKGVDERLFDILCVISQYTGWFIVKRTECEQKTPKGSEIIKVEGKCRWKYVREEDARLGIAKGKYLLYATKRKYSFRACMKYGSSYIKCTADPGFLWVKEKRITTHKRTPRTRICNIELILVTGDTFAESTYTLQNEIFLLPAESKMALILRRRYLCFLQYRVDFFSRLWKLPKDIVRYIFYLYDVDVLDNDNQNLRKHNSSCQCISKSLRDFGTKFSKTLLWNEPMDQFYFCRKLTQLNQEYSKYIGNSFRTIKSIPRILPLASLIEM